MRLARLDRYRDLVDDWPSFVDACTRPLPTTLWVNTLRVGVEDARARLAVDGVAAQPVPWYSRGLRVLGDGRPGKTLGYITGLVHIQEEVSMLPVAILDPQPGDRLLDLCSAPGNKTVQAAVHMGDRGTVVANDLHRSRVGMVVRNIERLGITNTIVTRFDGSSLPSDVGLFDRVIADVPCSCEGTIRKNLEILQREHDERWVGPQKALLRKAIQRCRPGGRIVYSTCTFAPEENEAVVDAMLHEYEGAIRVLPASVDAVGGPSLFRGAPGLVDWQGARYHPSLERTLRVWPHHNDTGGFFVALLERLEDSDSKGLEQTEEDVEPELVVRRIAA